MSNLIASTPAQRQVAQSRLEQYIAQGQARAVGLQERILREIPTDAVAKSEVLQFRALEPGFSASSPAGITVALGNQGGENRYAIHRHALGHLAEQAKMPMAYADHLLTQGQWGADLLARNLNDGVRLGQPKSRYLVRRVGTEVRAVLSSKFRRIDARPILDTLIGEAQRAGAIVVDGRGSDIRVEMKFIVPKIFEPAPGEFMVFGFAWSNSDFGAGANNLRAFANRLACWNGMTMEQALRQVHLGRQLTDDVEWSQQTLELDTRTAVSAARDTARALLSEVKIAETAEKITRAAEEGIDPKAKLESLKKRVSKTDAKEIADAFNSPDVVNLPAGNTMWRFSNAISLVARDAENVDRKLELERLAGDVLKAA